MLYPQDNLIAHHETVHGIQPTSNYMNDVKSRTSKKDKHDESAPDCSCLGCRVDRARHG
jgi:hypothetical protein